MATSKLSLKFRIFKGNELVGFRELNQAVIKIGKVPSAHVCIDDESISRMHAIIEVLDTTAHIIDLGSTRGTSVNGKRINKAKLSDGDAIEVGDIRLEVALSEVAAAAPAPGLAVAATPPRPVRAAPITAPAPVALMPAANPLASAPVAPAVFSETLGLDTEEHGVRAVEVATMLGDSVVDVKHCMDPRGGKVTPATWGFLAGGLACLLASATAFYVSVDTAATNRAALSYHTNVLHKPAYSYRPATNSIGVDWAAFGGLALGLLGMTAGLARARGEKKSPYYRIGTAAGVEQPVENAPTPDFPLVAPQGDEFVFNYGAGMDGELILDGKSTPLAELAASGRARPSLTVASAIEVPIPARSRIRARAGQTTFLVTAVAKPRKQAVPLFNIERRTAAYIAGSLALHIGFIAFLQTIPVDDSGVNVDLDMRESVAVKTDGVSADDVPPEQDKANDDGQQGDPTAGAQMALESGASGEPNQPAKDSHLRIKDNQTSPQLAREAAIEEARNAGFLGSYRELTGGIASITGTGPISSGFDGSNVYGALFGAEGSGGGFGFGRDGTGFGGGCGFHDCGLVGAGRYGTIGNGTKAGDGWGGDGGKGLRMKRDGLVPTVDISMPRPTDGLDKSIIKRYVSRNRAKISYCYESELLVKPDLAGVVTVQFLINASGGVTDSTGNGLDPKVANCVAGVIKNISFPKPSNGGSVQVNYPFTFRRAAGN